MKEKKNPICRRIVYGVAVYVIIYIIAILFGLTRPNAIDGEVSIRFVHVIQLLIFPALFVFAGYLGHEKFETGVYRLGIVLWISLSLAIVFLCIWYVSMTGSAIANLIAAQSCYALDHGLRGVKIMVENELRPMAETEFYKDLLLPVIYFTADLLYGFCFAMGSRIGASKKEIRRSKSKKKRTKETKKTGNQS